MPDYEDKEEAGEVTQKGPGVLIIGLASLLAAGGAGAAGYFMTAAPTMTTKNDTHQIDATEGEHSSKNDDAGKDAKHSEDNKKKKKKKSADHKSKNGKKAPHTHIGGTWHIIDDIAYFQLDPFVVSISPADDIRHLKISLIIKTPTDSKSAIENYTFEIRDIMTSYLRSIELTQIEAPAAMQSMREQLVRRIQFVSPNAVIEDVLITEFILT